MDAELAASAEMVHDNEVKDVEATTTASEKVFNTYELIEHIALQVDPSALPKLAQVNKACNTVFKRSESVIQQMMYSPIFVSKLKANYDLYESANPRRAITLVYMPNGSIVCYRMRQHDFLLLESIPRPSWRLLAAQPGSPVRTKVVMTREEVMARLGEREKESLREMLDGKNGMRVGWSGTFTGEVPQALSDALREIVEGKREGTETQSSASD